MDFRSPLLADHEVLVAIQGDTAQYFMIGEP
jgi:hypothetical protein